MAARDAGTSPGSEGALLHRTRRRLIAWSAGSTLVVLLVLGVAIYAAAASSLSAAGVAQLQGRVDELRAPPTFETSVVGVPPGGSLAGGGPAAGTIAVTADPGLPGVLIGGAASGTIALMLPNDPFAGGARGNVGTGITGTDITGPGATGMGVPATAATPVALVAGQALPFPDPETLAAAREGSTIIRESSLGSTPVRILVAPVTNVAGSFIAVVIGDRTAELDTLRTLLLVLLGGGLAVLAASIAVGYVYAGRALVPIRESLRRQREFAADASHELRTPLSITRAAVAELRRGRADPVVVDRALDDIDSGTTRLELLVDDLLLLARTDADAIALVLADTDLALAAAEATEAMEPVAAARGVRITLDVEPAPVRGDEARLRQLTGILLDNAIRHSPQGGRVTVTVRSGARLVVEDEGPGIAPEHLDHVFDRFWRAPDSPPGGTGLGLAIARWIAERHGGGVRAEHRAEGPGARFVVEVPGA